MQAPQFRRFNEAQSQSHSDIEEHGGEGRGNFLERFNRVARRIEALDIVSFRNALSNTVCRLVRRLRSARALENDFRSELQTASSDTVSDDVSREGITAIGVEGKAPKPCYSVGTAGGGACVHVWYSQPLVVKKIERLRLELNGQTLGDSGVLKHSHVDRVYGLTPLGVPTQRRERRAEEFLGR